MRVAGIIGRHVQVSHGQLDSYRKAERTLHGLTFRLADRAPERGFSASALSVTGPCPMQPLVSPLILQR